MSSSHLTVQAPAHSHERRIKADHLKLVLVTRRLNELSVNPQPYRWAAFSNGHDSLLSTGCPRRPHSPEMQHRLQHPPLLLTIRTVPEHLVRRVRLTRGLQEVRKTWGIGFKTMLAEAKKG